jgi:16S rRNA (guanine966-N2)-methyltransferase
MRIIAGKWRGRALASPVGDTTRPTADRVREALFSMLTSRLGDFEGLHVGDFYAGTGALGLEALSRGARHVSFVETDRVALAVLKTNIAAFAADFDSSVVPQAVENIGLAREACDVLLLDPPYGEGLVAPALARLQAQGWIAPHALISVETGFREDLAVPGFTVEVARKHGKAKLHLLRPLA